MWRSKTLFGLGLGAIAIGASALAHHPPRNPDASGLSSSLLEGAQIDPQTLDIVERACQNCHSERTQWPWYSHVPPASWLIHRDVARARERFNLSRWQGYSAIEKQAFLSAIGAAVRTGLMPPTRFTLLHPAGKLSPPEREHLYRWTRTERFRLRRQERPVPSSGDTSLAQ